MRFRTQIVKPVLLHRITRSLSALAKVCVVKLSTETVHFIVAANEGGKEGVQVWSQLKIGTLFKDFRIESNANNEIFLEINLEALNKVLKSAENAFSDSHNLHAEELAVPDNAISLKLNKGQGGQPIWGFEIRSQSRNGNDLIIQHEVNVKILSPKQQKDLQEPLCPSPDIHIILPELSELRNIVSRLKSFSDTVEVSANHEGRLDLRVEGSLIDGLTTRWENLVLPNSSVERDPEDPPPPPEKMFRCIVPISGFLKFLTSYIMEQTAIACLCEDHCLIAYVYIGGMDEDNGGVLTFFIPAKLVD